MLHSTEYRNSNLLPTDFTPGAKHVVIGKGKKFCQHSGNLYLRDIVHSQLSMYLNASSKVSKSRIISHVIEQVHIEGGMFVQLDKNTGRWIKSSDYLAREKTSQAFRDALRHQYKSSRQNKRRIKQVEEDVSLDPVCNNSTPRGLVQAPPAQEQQQSSYYYKRQRMEQQEIPCSIATPNCSTSASSSVLEFPTFPSSTSTYHMSNIISRVHHKNDEEEGHDDNDLFTTICSFLATTADKNMTSHYYCNDAVDDSNNPFEPTPLDEVIMMPAILSGYQTATTTTQENHEKQDRDDKLFDNWLQEIAVDNEKPPIRLLPSVPNRRIVSDS